MSNYCICLVAIIYNRERKNVSFKVRSCSSKHSSHGRHAVTAGTGIPKAWSHWHTICLHGYFYFRILRKMGTSHIDSIHFPIN